LPVQRKLTVINSNYVFDRNRAKKNSGGQGKNIDFYSGLNLDKKLNPLSKTYAQVSREQYHKAEVTDVSDLKDWERNILVEVDETFDPDDDSEDEECLARKAAK
jgi:hypothetical protein